MLMLPSLMPRPPLRVGVVWIYNIALITIFSRISEPVVIASCIVIPTSTYSLGSFISLDCANMEAQNITNTLQAWCKVIAVAYSSARLWARVVAFRVWSKIVLVVHMVPGYTRIRQQSDALRARGVWCHFRNKLYAILSKCNTLVSTEKKYVPSTFDCSDSGTLSDTPGERVKVSISSHASL